MRSRPLDGVDHHQPFRFGSLPQAHVRPDKELWQATARHISGYRKLQRVAGTEAAAPIHDDETLRFPIIDLDDEALAVALTEAWPRALRRASREAFEETYSAEHLATQVDREALLEIALWQITERQGTIA